MRIRMVSAWLLSQQIRTESVGVTVTNKSMREDIEMWHKATTTIKMAANNRKETKDMNTRKSKIKVYYYSGSLPDIERC